MRGIARVTRELKSDASWVRRLAQEWYQDENEYWRVAGNVQQKIEGVLSDDAARLLSAAQYFMDDDEISSILSAAGMSRAEIEGLIDYGVIPYDIRDVEYE